MKEEHFLINTLKEAKELASSNPQKSYEMAKKVLKQAEDNGYKRIEGEAYYHMAFACRVMSEYASGLDYSFKAMEIFEELHNEKAKLMVLNVIGIIYFYYGDYVSANNNFSNALVILEGIDDLSMKSSILNNLGEIHRLSEKWELANDYYFKALEVAFDQGQTINTSVISLNISEIYYQLGEREKSIDYLEKSHMIAVEEKNLVALGEIETKYGRVMFEADNYQKSYDYYMSALNKLNKINNKFYLIDLYINMAQLEEAKGGNALIFLNEALEISLKLGLQIRTSELYKLLGEYHERHHEYKQAISYYRLFYRKEKEVEARNLATRLEIMSLEFNFGKEKSRSDMFQGLSEQFKKEIDKSKEELEHIKIQNTLLITENSLDELTQLYNRRGINQLLTEKTKNLGSTKYVIYVLDIDYFKRYNDSWGHIQGDICLKMIANSLKELKFDDYFVGRFGGEEFMAFAKVKDEKEAYEIGEILRKTVRNLELYYSKDEEDIVSISIGCKVGDYSSDVDHIIQEADNQLYKAKELGRNKVIIKR